MFRFWNKQKKRSVIILSTLSDGFPSVKVEHWWIWLTHRHGQQKDNPSSHVRRYGYNVSIQFSYIVFDTCYILPLMYGMVSPCLMYVLHYILSYFHILFIRQQNTIHFQCIRYKEVFVSCIFTCFVLIYARHIGQGSNIRY